MSTSSINNYKQTVMDITTDLRTLRDYCVELGLDPSVPGIDEVLHRLAEDQFNVAIVGEFKRGKSTLINALLEQSILPADVLPCSATLNRVTYGIDPHATIEYRDGHSEDIPVDALEDYVTKLTPESEQRAANVKSATVYYPISFCKNGVTIIDTPGLNDDATMTEVTLAVLPETDAAIMVMMCGSPFSESEREFLESKIMASDLGRVIFVVTGIDRYDEEEQEKLLQLFRRRITDSVLNKAKSVYGENSSEFAVYQRKLGSIKIYPLSARNALRAKMKNDDAMLRESRFPEFEEGLTDFLARDRGALQLAAPVSRAKGAGTEILKAVELRFSTMGMDAEEFARKRSEAMATIEEIRAKRAEEMQRVTAASEATYQELLPQIESFWDDLETAAFAAVEAYPISSVKEMNSEATQQGLGNAVANALQSQSQLFAERVQYAIQTAMGEEYERLSGFESYFFDATQGIQSSFVAGENKTATIKKMALDGAASVLSFGLGNAATAAFDGYKSAGWKGALLGGSVATVGTAGTFFASAALATAVGLGALPVLPFIIASGIAGGALSRSVTGLAFKASRIEKFREDYKSAVHGQIQQLRVENDYTRTVRDQVESAFDALKQSVVDETETILENTQNQLNDLNVELATSERSREHESGRLEEIAQQASGIVTRASDLEVEIGRVIAQQD